MSIKLLLKLTTAAVLFAGAASADTEVAAWTDLHVRSGPGPMYSIVGVIPANEKAMVEGCLADASWCEVTYGDAKGWAACNYLTATVEDAPIALSTLDKRIVMKTVTYDQQPEATAGGLATGVIAGALVAGPVGAVVGGIVGAATGSALAPDPKVITYVTANPLQEIYLDGEVVVGAGIPETVTLVEVPDTTYSYAYINGARVLVTTKDRSVAYIVR